MLPGPFSWGLSIPLKIYFLRKTHFFVNLSFQRISVFQESHSSHFSWNQSSLEMLALWKSQIDEYCSVFYQNTVKMFIHIMWFCCRCSNVHSELMIFLISYERNLNSSVIIMFYFRSVTTSVSLRISNGISRWRTWPGWSGIWTATWIWKLKYVSLILCVFEESTFQAIDYIERLLARLCKSFQMQKNSHKGEKNKQLLC